MKPTISIEYCPKCHWLLRAAYMAQEFLTTFDGDLKSVVLVPSEVNGRYTIHIDNRKIFDRKEFGGFPEIKELKQMIRDIVAPGKDLGHTDQIKKFLLMADEWTVPGGQLTPTMKLKRKVINEKYRDMIEDMYND